MGFKNDFSQADSGNIKPEGDYECIITAVEEKTNRNGKTKLGVQMVIRNDIAGQKYGNAMLFYDIWKRKEPTQIDMQVGGYGFAGDGAGQGKEVCLTARTMRALKSTARTC